MDVCGLCESACDRKGFVCACDHKGFVFACDPTGRVYVECVGFVSTCENVSFVSGVGMCVYVCVLVG